MKPLEKKYWRIYAALQELCVAEDDDIEANEELGQFLKTAARAIYGYRFLGPRARSKKAEIIQLKPKR
jgi:hypothetical protein